MEASMRPIRTALALIISAGIGAGIAAQGMRGGTRIAPGEQCPPGTTEVRPGSCMAPQEAPPTILDYRPRNTLVTAEHKVAKAKFPAIDVHGHPGNVASADAINRVVGIMDSLNIKVMLVAENVSGQRLAGTMAALNASPHKDRFRVLAGVNFGGVGPGWGQKAAQQLEADLKAGAIGVGEVPKSFGLRTRKADGSRLRIDDPELDPLWAAFARLDVPAFIHTAEPQEFFQKVDFHNERWLELALFSDRRNDASGVTFEELMTERNNVFRKHPKTRFVAAHFGWHANDLGRLAKLLDEFPNVTIEAGAILYDLGRQPRAAREFFTKYADRIMFGKDSFQPEEYPYYWRVFETADEYFDYYRDYHATWKMYGMSLPDDVLKKVYYKTALKVFKGLPQAGWPQ
jgi:predicted TIM-barrel fold metal-dependent hydrolase